MARILSIIPYEFYPPASGGALRCFYILREMSRQHEVSVLTVQPIEDFTKQSEVSFPANVEVINLFQQKKFTSFANRISARGGDAVNYRFLKQSLFSDTNSFLLQVYPTLKHVLKQKNFDIVYYENLEVLGLLQPIVKRQSPASVHLYDAHNCDSDLWMKQANNEKKKVLLKYARKALATERVLYKTVDAFFCCSKEDNTMLSILNKNRIKGAVIPNGVNTATRAFDRNEEKYFNHELLFCGSLDYFPNIEGLQWFYKEVFPLVRAALPSVSLTVIGNLTGPQKYDFLKNDLSVNLIGKVDTVVPYYKKAAVSIVPLKTGSGTRLKILEAMSMGNPVVSTTIGAEGIDFIKGKHILIAESASEFASQIVSLFNDGKKFNMIRREAFELAKLKYEWREIGVEINKNIEIVLANKNGS
jgi:glycosyltransferase involved in cell wall biosynthesis